MIHVLYNIKMKSFDDDDVLQNFVYKFCQTFIKSKPVFSSHKLSISHKDKNIRIMWYIIHSQGSGGAFAGFGGFAFKPTQTSTPLLGFGQKTETKISFDQPDSTSKIQKQNGEVNAVGAVGQSSQSTSASATSRSDYLSNLKALNNSVLEWITQHVRKNPYCILTPIFKDYEKHLSELERGKEKSESNGSSSQPTEPQQMETGKVFYPRSSSLIEPI